MDRETNAERKHAHIFKGNILLWRVVTRMEAEHKYLSVNPLLIPMKLDFPNRLTTSRDTDQYYF